MPLKTAEAQESISGKIIYERNGNTEVELDQPYRFIVKRHGTYAFKRFVVPSAELRGYIKNGTVKIPHEVMKGIVKSRFGKKLGNLEEEIGEILSLKPADDD